MEQKGTGEDIIPNPISMWPEIECNKWAQYGRSRRYYIHHYLLNTFQCLYIRNITQ